ncbi:carboxylesterase family protein [candidate division KSB1 bacterium]|nr:carboxylesterase family protein [candidate division KSB1 bacterium]RQW10007.1 MAG: carboxylesterase family protein [candidate division KSB1 bacterium]
MNSLTKKWRPLILLVAACLSLFACASSEKNRMEQTVRTLYGVVQGVVNGDGSVLAFKGIPFAAPPVGDLRWREPQPPAAWDGVRDASHFCASCMQNRRFTHLPNGPWSEEFMVQDSVSEDCLYLNIWTPAKTNADRLPVLVYIHGGALTEGSGSIAVYDGEALAKKGIIVITINYRLGALGFLAHPELTAETPHHFSGNYGFLDQVAALQWIKDNIAVFGGDPSRVTIAGQSAGAASVRALIASPLAADLFHRAITQSGSTFSRGPMGGSPTLSEAEERGLEFARLKGASSLAELRALPAEAILADTQPAMRFGAIIDGHFLTADMMAVFAEGGQNDTPFVTGLNADETRYRGDRGEAFQALYPSGSEAETAAAEKTAGQEQSRLNAYLWLAYRAKTSKTDGYGYYFDRAIPWPEYPQFGAFHTGEVPYVFNNLKMLARPWTRVDTLVAEQMSSYWVNFVKNGDPNGPGLPLWAPYDSTRHEVMRLGEKMAMMPIAASEERLEFLKRQLLESH